MQRVRHYGAGMGAPVCLYRAMWVVPRAHRQAVGKGPKARWALRHSRQLSSSAWKAIRRDLRDVQVDGVCCPADPTAALPLLLWWAALDGNSRVLWLWHHRGDLAIL